MRTFDRRFVVALRAALLPLSELVPALVFIGFLSGLWGFAIPRLIHAV